ncbi:hypothetical protein VSH64_31970 [Amycolatopsis rhabdoformis]|uniref:TfoX N-terminal domain-containing protein n=1 Tax=Amycolatopsis rhabdoformis TaxID=1448059 RepID=A0ABZ1I1C9_9PSEU|nr:hypothetical protein [Amycolatopsis rhabdoformis]WSE27460.1 hypothetical protein VSH64_31970 [Amycolatopsis rhabdoformis]
MSPEDRFEDLIDELLAEHLDGVEPPRPGRGFGSSALRVHNRIFAMLVREHLVVKLPKPRVDTLVTEGHGVRFDANKGTPMKEWFVLADDSSLGWSALAREALTFVDNAPGKKEAGRR